MSSVYRRLPRPFVAMAPMKGITDTVFRRMLCEIAKPDLLYTEFAWAEGLCSPKPTRFKQQLEFHTTEHPIVAQLWGRSPAAFERAAAFACRLGFDGIDINMGCAVRKILKRGTGAGLIATPKAAAEIIAAVRSGAPDLPLSVKTRLGMNEVSVEHWCGFLLEQRLDALCVHARTAAQGYGGSADWNAINAVIALRNRISPDTVVIGNGDLSSTDHALSLHARHPVDGFMIGRAVLLDPYVLQRRDSAVRRDRASAHAVSPARCISLFREHVALHRRIWGKRRNAGVLKRFVAVYLAGIPEYTQLRRRLLRSETHAEMLAVLSTAAAKARQDRPAHADLRMHETNSPLESQSFHVLEPSHKEKTDECRVG